MVSGIVAGTAVMPSSHVTVEGPGEIHVESSTRYSRGGREESGRAARSLARWEKRNGARDKDEGCSDEGVISTWD